MVATVSANQTKDLKPAVGRPVSNRGVWIFAGALALAAVLLFTALEARRTAMISPATAAARDMDAGIVSPPPPLQLSAGLGYDEVGVPPAPKVPSLGSNSGQIPRVMPGVPTAPRVVQAGRIPSPPIVRAPSYFESNPPVPVYRAPTMPTAQPATDEANGAAAVPGQLAGKRVSATRFANPAMTVPQGTVIPAVLETALDSNRPGFVRAIVSRDVRSFDGSRVLIPRGSRLFGEYKADLGQGQKRVFVQWQTLTRPDGVQIALDSPAADPLGRAGVGGKVNTHFWPRFGNALLQSTLDIGVGLATRSAGGGTIVLGLPGATQTLIQPQQESYKPTVAVKHGTSVSVFVARDLDFSTVEQ
jgi:type IV secretion system protein VirB10